MTLRRAHLLCVLALMGTAFSAIVGLTSLTFQVPNTPIVGFFLCVMSCVLFWLYIRCEKARGQLVREWEAEQYRDVA